MITHNDFFSGELGKTSKLQLPKMYSTPRTNRLDYDYSVSLGSNIRGDTVACSLDARLWLFRISRRLAVVVCNWDEEKGKLVRSAASNISNNYDVMLARGINWVLSNNMIFMADENSPYIQRANLFNSSNDETFFYSMFRSSALTAQYITHSGIGGVVKRIMLTSILKAACFDPESNSFWGQLEANGNNDGDAFFSKDSHLLYPVDAHTFEQCYSLLPTVGDWIIFENFLVRRPDKPLTKSYHGMLNLRPLIPLELYWEKVYEGTMWEATTCIPAFGHGYNLKNRGIQVAYLHNQLWGRGVYHIGKVFIIAAGFDKNGDAQEFYLYISPDFHDLNLTITQTEGTDTSTEGTDKPILPDWSTVAIASIGDNETVYGFFSEEPDPLSGGMCIASTNSYVLDTSKKNPAWEPLSGSDETDNSQPHNDDDTNTDETDDTHENSDSTPEPNDNTQEATVDSSDSSTQINGHTSDDVDPLREGKDSSTDLDEQPSQLHGKIFFDYANSSALLLDDLGAKVFLDSSNPTLDFSCSNLRQWLAPADLLDAISKTGIIARDDRSAFFTELQRGFHRALLTPCVLPLSASSYMTPDLSDHEQRGENEKINSALLKLSVATETNSSNSSISLLVKHSFFAHPDLNEGGGSGASGNSGASGDNNASENSDTSGSNDHSENSDIALTEHVEWEDVYRKPVTLKYIGHASIEADSPIEPLQFFGLHKTDTSSEAWNDYLSQDTGGLGHPLHKKEKDFIVYLWDFDDCFCPLPIFYTRVALTDKDSDPNKKYWKDITPDGDDLWNIFVSKYPEYEDKFNYFINLEDGDIGFDPDLFIEFYAKWADATDEFLYNFFYHSIEADIAFVNLQTLSVQKMTVSAHSSDDIIGGKYGPLALFASNNVLGFQFRVLDTTPENPLNSAYELDDGFWTERAWSQIEYTGSVEKDAVAANVPDSLLNFCADFDYLTSDERSLAALTQQKKDSLVAPSIRLAYITCSEKFKDASVAVFFLNDSNIPFLLEFPVENIKTSFVCTYPDRTYSFRKKNGQKYSKSQLHMALIYSDDRKKLDIYSFRSEYNHNVFDFDDDLERCKPS